MARIMKLKEYENHKEETIGSNGSTADKAIDVYDTREELDDEKTLCIIGDNGKTGYIPLVTGGARASKINVLCDNNEVYKMAIQKKNMLDEIVSCKIKLYLTADNPNVEVVPGTSGNDFFQVSISNKKAYGYASARPYFYDKNGEDITQYIYCNEEPTQAIFTVNSYHTRYSTGFFTYSSTKVSNVNLIKNADSYYNVDHIIEHSLVYGVYRHAMDFNILILTNNTTCGVTNKITFKNLTINGRKIPFVLERIN